MKPSHPSAGSFARSGFFDGLDRLSDLEAKISALSPEKTKGDAFEVFVEGWIATSHRFQAKQIWPGSTLPATIRNNLKLSATGIGGDGVYEDRNGEYAPPSGCNLTLGTGETSSRAILYFVRD